MGEMTAELRGKIANAKRPKFQKPSNHENPLEFLVLVFFWRLDLGVWAF